MKVRLKKIVTSSEVCATKSLQHSNNTPQAYPVVRRRDAQTGGLLFLWVRHAV